MTPDERELRRALEARSGVASPEFRARVRSTLNQERPTTSALSFIALVAAAVLTITTVGVLLLVRLPAPGHGGPVIATPPKSPSSSPKGGGVIYLPTDVQLSAPSGDVVWAFVAESVLFRSTDRGSNWEQRSPPPHHGGGTPEISFVDAQNGWLSIGGVPETQCNGAGEELWRTSDGAATWQQVALVEWTQPARTDTSGISYAQCKEGLSFIDPTHGFLAAWDDNHRPTIYRTSDGGRTWIPSTLPDPPGFITQAGGFVLRAGLVKSFGGTLLVAASGQQGEYVFRSTDGGASWNYVARSSFGANNLTLVTASRWLYIGNDQTGLETTDAGRTWHSYPTDYANAAGVVTVFVFGTDLVGYGTVRGGMNRTLDGGRHWVIIETPGVFWPG